MGVTITKGALINAALKCARKKVYKLMTREDIAKQANVAPSLVSHYLGSMKEIQDLVIARAIEMEDHQILSQGIVFKHPALKGVSRIVRHRIYLTLKSGEYDDV